MKNMSINLNVEKMAKWSGAQNQATDSMESNNTSSRALNPATHQIEPNTNPTQTLYQDKHQFEPKTNSSHVLDQVKLLRTVASLL